MLAAIGSFLLAFALPQVPPEPAIAADPAIYVVRDGDTTIYLFGTFHVLRSNVRWFGGPVERAFEDSDQLVVETVPPDAATLSQPVAPIGPVQPAASFLNSAQNAVRAGQSQGMNLADGADMVLIRKAAAEGKKIEPLETIQSQLTMFKQIPAETAAIPAPVADPRPDRALDDVMLRLEAAWRTGDHGLFAGMLSDMRASAPDAYRLMFVERNARWTYWVAARMREPGTVFVAVGAGHLAGPDSLLVRLAQRGIISRRLL